MARIAGVPLDYFVLRRRRRTASQVGLTVDQRRRNVAGAFMVDALRRERIKGRNIVASTT